jgi:NAD(P)H-hydrate epimerase
MNMPAVTADQMREIDRIMVEELHIELVQMMENAGRNLADLAQRRFRPTSVLVIAGVGGNGGGGLVAARHLANRGLAVSVVVSRPESVMTAATAHQFDIVARMELPVVESPVDGDLVIDALIGYSLHGDPRPPAAELIDWMNRRSAPVLSLDAPSGLDVTSGRAGTPCVRATATMTLALAKVGLLRAPESVGELYVADISVPPLAFDRIGIQVGDLFAHDSIVKIAPPRQ